MHEIRQSTGCNPALLLPGVTGCLAAVWHCGALGPRRRLGDGRASYDPTEYRNSTLCETWLAFVTFGTRRRSTT